MGTILAGIGGLLVLLGLAFLLVAAACPAVTSLILRDTILGKLDGTDPEHAKDANRVWVAHLGLWLFLVGLGILFASWRVMR